MYACMSTDVCLCFLCVAILSPSSMFLPFSHMEMLFFRHMNAIISYTELYHMHVPVIPKLIEIRLVSVE